MLYASVYLWCDVIRTILKEDIGKYHCIVVSPFDKIQNKQMVELSNQAFTYLCTILISGLHYHNDKNLHARPINKPSIIAFTTSAKKESNTNH